MGEVEKAPESRTRIKAARGKKRQSARGEAGRLEAGETRAHQSPELLGDLEVIRRCTSRPFEPTFTIFTNKSGMKSNDTH